MTARVRVRLFALLRELADAGTVEASGATAGEVAAALAARYGERFASVVETSTFVVNGERATAATPVRDGDEVAILPPVSGGAAGALSSTGPASTPSARRSPR